MAATAVAALAVTALAGPAHAATRNLYVSNLRGNSVSVVDPATDTVIATVPVGTNPFGAAVTPDGSQAWVTNNGSNTVSVIDTATNTVVTTVAVGRLPQTIAFSPDGSRAYVGHFVSPGVGGVDVIDTAAATVLADVPVDNQPDGIAVTPDGSRVYVADFVGSSVDVIDAATNTVAARIADSGARTPNGIVLSPDGSHAYTANFNSNNVSDIDTATNTIRSLIPGFSGPAAVALSADGSRLYVANENGNTVGVVDTATDTVVATFPAGPVPTGIVVDGATGYVSDAGSNTVSVFDTGTDTVTATIPVGNTPIAVAQAPAPIVLPPAVAGISPASGPRNGGTTVTITGAHLTGTTGVSFGGVPALNVTVVNDSTVTALAPAHAAGGVDVTVTTPVGTSAVVAGDRYTFLQPAPTITGVSPGTGPAAGGTLIAISGNDLDGATVVTVGGVPATSFSVDSPTRISAVVPAEAAGTVDVAVTTSGGTSVHTAADQYTYTKDTTSLAATPLLLSLGSGALSIHLHPQATLADTTTRLPVAGATVTFSVAGYALCTATTDAHGVASCTGLCPLTVILLAGSYTAAYAGDPSLAPASATAGLISLGGVRLAKSV